MIRLFVLAVTFALPLLAAAEPYMVLGRAIDLSPPPGYCVVGKTPAERQYLERYKDISKSALELLQASVPCSDLKKFNAKLLSQFPRTALVSVVKAKGQLTLETGTRQQFLSRFGKPESFDVEAVNTRLRKALTDKTFAAAMSKMTPLGSDGDAYYWATLGTAQAEGMPLYRVTSVSAALLINRLPLSVQASESVGFTDGPAPASIVQNQIKSILVRNP